jgi:PAS domain S-box-containing protein
MLNSDRLLLSNDQFQSIVELCPEPIVIFCDNIIEYVNTACANMIGASTKSQIIGKHIIEFILPEDVERTYSHNEELIKASNPSNLIEKKWVRLDGQIITVEFRAVPIKYGTKTAIQLLCRDITQQRRIEEFLQESEQRLYHILQQSPDAIVVHHYGIINYINNAGLKLFHASNHDQMIGRSIYDFIHADFHNAARERSGLMTNEGKHLDFTIHLMVRLDGKIFSAEVSSTEINTPSDKGHIQTVLRDVSVRVKLEEAQIKSSLGYQRLIKFLPEPIVITDNNGVIQYTNVSSIKLLKASHEDEVVGKNIFVFIHPDHHEESIMRYRQVIETDIASPFLERVLICTNGDHITVEISSIRIEYMEKQTTLSVLRDLTERKNTEERFVRSEKLSAIGQLAAGVAHEIRNPLTALKGFTQLLQRELGDKYHYLSIMQSEIARINEIVNEFMSLSKPHLVQFSSGNIRTILQGVISILETQAILKNVTISLDDSELFAIIHCDENQLKQVFINIISNAMDAMPQGGQIYIFIYLINDEQLLIRIQDQGHGIPEDIIGKIGEPFFTTKDSGTGLGLMICHRIIEAHHGKILITSKVNTGTTVDIILPNYA